MYVIPTRSKWLTIIITVIVIMIITVYNYKPHSKISTGFTVSTVYVWSKQCHER